MAVYEVTLSVTIRIDSDNGETAQQDARTAAVNVRKSLGADFVRLERDKGIYQPKVEVKEVKPV